MSCVLYNPRSACLRWVGVGLLVLLVAGDGRTVGAVEEGIDGATLEAIRREALERSQVMDHLGWLSDVYGPRLTGSPAIEAAGDWAVARLTEWGVQRVHKERFAFGPGWSVVRFSAHLLEPQVQPLIGYPRAWSSSTDGPVEADVVRAAIVSEDDFERYRGTLRGKIVLSQQARRVRPLEGDVVLRMNQELLAEAETLPVPEDGEAAEAAARRRRQREFRLQVRRFWYEEGVVAVLDRGSDGDRRAGGSDLSWRTQRVDGGTIFVGDGGPRDAEAGRVAPSATLAVEHYNRMVRVLDRGLPVRMEIDIQARFFDETEPNGFNIIGEIPGSDLADEVVMLGAHFDSTHAGTGATDDAVGSAAMMEALRVLLAVGVQPRRTVRIGLWGGEEQGLLGSKDYVRRHLGDPDSGDRRSGYEQFSVYLNIDNGSGRVRGVWLQGNEAARPLWEQWLEAVSDLGAATLGPRAVGGTDHLSFDHIGLPGFQLMQDRVEYNSRTHHSNMDVYDHVVEEDVVQMAAVVAVLAYSAAMDDRKMPRKSGAEH